MSAALGEIPVLELGVGGRARDRAAAEPVGFGGEAGDRGAWVGAGVDAGACVVELGERGRAELLGMAAAFARAPLPMLLREAGEYISPRQTPALEAGIGRVRALLDEGPGVAVLAGIPLEELERESADALFWVIGQRIGRPVATKWDGTMLYDVHDTGRAFGYGVRASWTNVELPFHTDNPCNRAMPEYVALLCLHPAKRGGESRFVSLRTVHDRLAELDRAAWERLYEPVLWDRQAEHPPDEPRIASAPVFALTDGGLEVRLNTTLIRRGYELAGRALDGRTARALERLDEVLADSRIWTEVPLERGQIQYLNNRAVAHYRGAFEDHPEPERRRHLVRMWHRAWGRRSFAG